MCKQSMNVYNGNVSCVSSEFSAKQVERVKLETDVGS